MEEESRNLIVLEPDENHRELLESVVLDHDLSMQTAYDVDDAYRLMAQPGVFAYVFSLHAIPGEPFEYVRELKTRHPEIPLFLIREPGESDLEVWFLQMGVVGCLDRSQITVDFAYQMVKLLAGRTDFYNPFSLRYEERLLILPNDFGLVMQVAKTIVDTTLPLGNKNRYQLILGLSEIITNAVEHGNLGITYDEKANALRSSNFFSMALERAHREPYRSRTVTLRSRVLPHARRIEFQIGDQGQGFNWHSLPDPTDKKNLLARHGRGILMARRAFDEVHFNEKGNEVTLVINLDSQKQRRTT